MDALEFIKKNGAVKKSVLVNRTSKKEVEFLLKTGVLIKHDEYVYIANVRTV